MVADGYWLQAEGTEWRRVTLADYITAMTSQGLRISPTQAVRSFKADRIRGTTQDPNAGLAEIPRLHARGRTLTEEDYAEIARRFSTAVEPARRRMQQLVDNLLAALEPLSQFMAEVKKLEGQQCPDHHPPTPTPPTPTSGEPTPTQTDPKSGSKPVSDAGSRTGGT